MDNVILPGIFSVSDSIIEKSFPTRPKHKVALGPGDKAKVFHAIPDRDTRLPHSITLGMDHCITIEHMCILADHVTVTQLARKIR